MTSILRKQIDLQPSAHSTYSASWHADWSVGNTFHGGCIVAIIHHAAETHLRNTPALNQPDVLNLHVEFLPRLRAPQQHHYRDPFEDCTFQVELSQKGEIKAFALVTSTNFDRPLGPTVSTAWNLLPPPRPKPDFDRVLKHEPDPNWVPAIYSGEVIPFTGRILVLNPREGLPVDGICDAWNGFEGEERIDSTTLAFMTDLIPSMSDTLLRNGGIYDAHAFQAKARQWADENPGVPAPLKNSLADAMKAATLNQTAMLDVEFKRRLPPAGLQFVFMRTTTKMLLDGRMDTDLTVHDENMEILCTSRQVILVLEAGRKFRKGRNSTRTKL
ncbi:hypothetical protein PG993_011764 [Apiospora rasikravindrae]|uniref:Thioesterase-like superfamily-domain-containing protein n=1 Tax=Apiospora rasikravindrae TaxID=990691 RepID=A0ABR1S0Q2_9PEZI